MEGLIEQRQVSLGLALELLAGVRREAEARSLALATCVVDTGGHVIASQRMDGVAENFHTEQNRELLEHLANQTGGRYWKPADLGKLAGAIPFSEAGVTTRETKDLWDLPLVFLVLLLLRFSEWWLRRKWGIV